MIGFAATVFCLILAAPASASGVEASPAWGQAALMNVTSRAAARSGSPERTMVYSGLTADGSGLVGSGVVVNPQGDIAPAAANLTVSSEEPSEVDEEVPTPGEGGEVTGWKKWVNPLNWPSWAQYGGAALVGIGIGAAAAGLPGAIVGGALALGGLLGFRSGKLFETAGMVTGAAAGWALGAVAGGSVAGPLGAVVGAFLGIMWGAIFKKAAS